MAGRLACVLAAHHVQQQTAGWLARWGTLLEEKGCESACIVAPRQVAIVAFLRLTVAGKQVLVHPGATLYHALEESGVSEPSQVLATLAVRRPYLGRPAPIEFSRAARDILSLPLSGREEIRW